jgi:hypothetical protein
LWGVVQRTLVDKFELRDDVQANFGEFVLEHLKEHGQEVVNGPGMVSSDS